MNVQEVFDELAHDLRGALGSLRLVMSSLAVEDDASGRSSMADLADEEVRRMAASLPALPALALAASDHSEPAVIDLEVAMTEAAATAARLGTTVSMGDVPAVQVSARAVVAGRSLAALFVLAAGVDGTVTVSAAVVGETVEVRFDGAPLSPQERRLGAHLVSVVGGWVVDPGRVFRFSLRVRSRGG